MVELLEVPATKNSQRVRIGVPLMSARRFVAFGSNKASTIDCSSMSGLKWSHRVILTGNPSNECDGTLDEGVELSSYSSRVRRGMFGRGKDVDLCHSNEALNSQKNKISEMTPDDEINF